MTDSDSIFLIEPIGSIEDINNDNIDVYVTLANGKKYVATFFTLANIATLINRYKKSGECNHGSYFWASDMIIVQNLNPLTLRETISNLLETEEFESAFTEVEDTC